MSDFPRAAALIAALALGVSACTSASERPPTAIVDEQVSLQRGESHGFPFEIAKDTQVQIEVSNLDGEHLSALLLSRTEKANLDMKKEWWYFTAFSHEDVDERFDSGWRTLKGPAVYTVMLRPHDKHLSSSDATPQAPTRAHVRVQTK